MEQKISAPIQSIPVTLPNLVETEPPLTPPLVQSGFDFLGFMKFVQG